MKERLLISVLLLFLELHVWGQENSENGIPFFVNYKSEIYGAHDRNIAVICDTLGNSYFANFEGLLKFNGSEWSLTTTPGISRVTALLQDEKGNIWVGGFNVAGKLEDRGNGQIIFQACVADSGKFVQRIGEVKSIQPLHEGGVLFVAQEALVTVRGDSVAIHPVKERLSGAFKWGDQLLIQQENGKLFLLKEECLYPYDQLLSENTLYTVLCDLPDRRLLVGTVNGLFALSGGNSERVKFPGIPGDVCVNDLLIIGDNTIVVATATNGLLFIDSNLRLIGRVDESNGLCNNMVNSLAGDNRGVLWGATAGGIFRMNVPSSYSVFTETEGLQGELICMIRHNGILYAGTYQGLYYLDKEKSRFRAVSGITQACWQLTPDSDGNLWAATGGGLFQVQALRAFLFNSYFTMCVMPDPDDRFRVYTGEQDGVYLNRLTAGGKIMSREICRSPGQVNSLLIDKFRNLWAVTLFGEIFQASLEVNVLPDFKKLEGVPNQLGNRFFDYLDTLFIISGNTFYTCRTNDRVIQPYKLIRDSFPVLWWPGLCVAGTDDILWLTGLDGKGIVTVRDGKLIGSCNQWLKAIGDFTVRVIYDEGQVTWLGGGFGLIRAEKGVKDPAFILKPSVFIRKVLNPSERNIYFTFASDASGVIKPVVYSYRLLGFEREWSEWQIDGQKEYSRLPYGKYCFEVKARDNFGQESESKTVFFDIPWPFYLKWYAWCFYTLAFICLIFLFFRWRTRKLLKEKARLETVIQQRTHEIRLQRDEIRGKSQQLEHTLTELNKAQDDLIRQEKMATVGKLTKGLVDRILNPLNYIGNFTELSRGLAEEAKQLICSGQQYLPQESYHELVEILNLLTDNLSKVSGHSINTTRILKAMEEILKEKACLLAPVGLNELCRKEIEVLNNYFGPEILENHILISFKSLPEDIIIEIDERQLSRAILSILNNGIKALLKKVGNQAFIPQLSLEVTSFGIEVQIVIRDNGIGIEDAILDKIFDPFFTTRTTAEAAGVGLYLTREVILNHKGKISVQSEKGVYTQFTLILPCKQDK